jgi:RNA polymerase sigma factor (sigma-70 family)
MAVVKRPPDLPELQDSPGLPGPPTTAHGAPVKVEDHTLPAITPDEKSFLATYEPIAPQLMAHARRYLDRDGAKDAVAEATADIWNRLQEGKLEKTPDVAFFFRAVQNQISMARRRRKRERPRFAAFVYEWARGKRRASAPDAELQRAEFRALLDTAVAQLSPACQESWVLVHESRLKYQEVAESLGITRSAVKQNMARAHASVREVLAGAGFDGEVVDAALSEPMMKLLPARAAEGDAHE